MTFAGLFRDVKKRVFKVKLMSKIRRTLVDDAHSVRNGTAEVPQFSLVGQKLLSGKTALITGAGRNIGKSIALEMAAHGASIVMTDLHEERCRQLETELKNLNVRSWWYRSDVSNVEDIEKLCQSLREKNIHIDILVNNAGIQFENGTIQTFKVAEWQQTFETNLIGPLHLTKIISDRMIQRRTEGSIIFLTSIHQWTVARLPAYSSSKAALGMAIKELALDLAPYGIRVNAIAPGWVRTNKSGGLVPDRYTPLYHKTIDPCYIGRAAVYLASEYFSKHTTGSVLQIDGGLSLFNHRVHSTWNEQEP